MNNTFEYFHQFTRQSYQPQSAKINPAGSHRAPIDWIKIYFKEYPRMPKINLPKPAPLDSPIGQIIIQRQSSRDFQDKPIEIDIISQLLFYSCGITKPDKDPDKTRRSYPSAGARYPLEIYPIILNGDKETEEGLYHYNVKEHNLEKLLVKKDIGKDIYSEIIGQDMILKSPLILVISAAFGKTVTKYKDRGYRYILFEAGHVGQNIHLVSQVLGLKCCAIGGFDDDKLNDFLDIDGEKEAALYALVLGY